MRNKKSPAMMIVAAVLILGFAFFVNATSFFTRPLLPPAAPKAPEGAPAPKLSADASKSMLKQSLVKRDEGEERGAPKPTEGIPEEPAILKPKVKRYNPTPNPTSTAAHWWEESGVLQKQSEETREKRGF